MHPRRPLLALLLPSLSLFGLLAADAPLELAGDVVGVHDAAATLRADEPAETPAAVETPGVEADEASATAGRIARLIEQLGDGDYFVRERAQQELVQIGFEAFDALSAAEDHDDVEVAARAKYLVRTMRIDWTAEGDPAEVKSLLLTYPSANETARLELIKRLAALPDDKGLLVLCRIVRFERSTLLSKQAAVAVLDQKPDGEAWPRRERAIRQGIGSSTRAGAEWLKTYLASRADPAAAVDAWRRRAEAEEKTLSETPRQTNHEIVAALRRKQAALLRQLDRRDEAVAAMLRIVSLEQGEPQTLTELVDWLVEQQAWSVLDEVHQRFADQFKSDPMLMYTLAQARLAQGDEARALALAGAALALNDADQQAHYVLYVPLQQRHWVRWAEQELRRTIEIGPPTSVWTISGQSVLAELLHDRGDDLAAAQLAEAAVTSMEANISAGRAADNRRLELGRLKARLYFFRACDVVSPKAVVSPEAGAKRIEHLRAAAKHDPTDADVLIALYRIPHPEPELRKQTLEWISAAATEFRRRIQQDPDEETHYNQLAWLIANTEGDFQEALNCSRKSLELRPNDPGLLDTLGRCYYALGDLENAVKYQSKAVELNPHSGLMNKQLALFREELAKKKPK
ncbi:MAG TPA: tetratricopeptide repeat protein [Pirellulales bacterium]|nr:tetratricopeptide repeat protein [Pirellulales bacterium]